MSKRVIVKSFKIFRKYHIAFRFGTALLGIVSISLLTQDVLSQSRVQINPVPIQEKTYIDTGSLFTSNNNPYNLPSVTEQDIMDSEERYAQKLLAIEKENLEQEYAERAKFIAQVNALQNYLYRQGSPMAPYAELIITSANRCGIDYKIAMAIAGNESYFGKRGGGVYFNAWGWGPHYRYSSWEQSIPNYHCNFAKQYIRKGYTTIETIAPRYGANNQEEWISDVYWFYNRIP